MRLVRTLGVVLLFGFVLIGVVAIRQPLPLTHHEPTGTPGPADPELFVQADGTRLTHLGEDYTFTGMNVYQANNRVPFCSYPMNHDSLMQSFADMGPGVQVMRAWFFQDFATVDGHLDFAAFDETVMAAEAAGVKLIVTLGNQWSDCDSEGLKTAEWYENGYKERNPALPMSYRDYVQQVVWRYLDRPSILMWQLLNEAEVPLFEDGLCVEDVAHPLLKAWAEDMSGLIKNMDPHHLVSIGTIGSGQCGAQWVDYKALHDIPTVDICEFHDYGEETMPGDEWNGLAFRIQQCAELNKPIFIGETGIVPDWLDGTLESRAALFADKLETQFGAGVVGIVLWAWDAFDSATHTYDIGPGDPVLDVLAQYSQPDPDADNDGVHDDIDTGDGTFAHGVTTGSIVDPAGLSLLVAPHPSLERVRITATGSSTGIATVAVCGWTVQVYAGSDLTTGCGSITLQVAEGQADLVLADGLTVVSVTAGSSATVDELPDGGFSLTGVTGSGVTVTVDGVTSPVAEGSEVTVQTWSFDGFDRPVDNGGVVNAVKAGQAIPLRWRLVDAEGQPVTDLTRATVTVRSLACDAGASIDQLEEVAAGATGLQHLGDGYYQFTWSTPKSYANSCKTMRLDVGDGVLHEALFAFKK